MRLLLTVSALLSLTACFGSTDKPDDSADSVPLVADSVITAGYGVRCAIPEDGEACYVMDGMHTFKGQPGELFPSAGSLDCPFEAEAPSLSIHVFPGARLDPEGDGGAEAEITVTFDCAGQDIAEGQMFYAEEWLVGDMGTVLHINISSAFSLE